MTMIRSFIAGALVIQVVPAFAVTDARVERVDATNVTVRWREAGPVSIYVADDPFAGIAKARLVQRQARGGVATIVSDSTARRYYLLRTRDGRITRTAERQLPLDRGSNFRDIGGYSAAGGKHVRWGLIYRSGATPLLTPADIARVQALGLKDMIDLRSSEERVIAPTRITGVRYTAVDYSMMSMMGERRSFANGAALYHNFPRFFAPQLRIVFDDLVRQQRPILYNCSAGQDRTGFVTAMILSALGVPRATIIEDYHLSTALRQPANELPPIDEAMAKSNPVAGMFAAYQKMPGGAVAQPLKEADGTPFLAGAFAEIDSKWGSVDRYLAEEVGVTPAQLAAMRKAYLE